MSDRTERALCRIVAIVFVAMLLALCSCSRKIYIPVESVTYHTDTLRVTALRVDSVFQRDSIAVIQRGDTVYVTKYRDRFRFRDRTDTLYKAVVDTARISVPYPVEKQMSRWDRMKLDIGGLAIATAAALLCLIVVAFIIKRRKL